MDPIESDDEFAISIGRFAGDLYFAFAALVTFWTIASGHGWDWWIVTFVAACLAAKAVTLLPWNGYGRLMAPALVVSASVLITIYTPLFIRVPVLFLGAAVSAAYTRAAIDKRWMATLIPIARHDLLRNVDPGREYRRLDAKPGHLGQ